MRVWPDLSPVRSRDLQTFLRNAQTGLIARRIVPWVQTGDVVAKGERVSLIQFGSRVDLYLPLKARIAVSLGDRVVGGETVMARLDG